MSDFLHNLRTGNLKRFDRPRKNYDNPQHRHQHDRQHHKDRKGNYHKKVHTGDQLQDIKKHIELMVQISEKSLKAQDKAAAALERIAAAFEATAGIEPANSTEPLDSQAPPVPEPAAPKPADPKPVDPKPVDLEQTLETAPPPPVGSETDLMETIVSLRSSGASFEKIARELEAKKVPTASGRGKWRGQAVSKLLKANAG